MTYFPEQLRTLDQSAMFIHFAVGHSELSHYIPTPTGRINGL